MKSKPAKILYIEDDKPSRLLVKRVLESSELEFEFHEAANGIDGIRLAHEIGPDLILIDLHLPDYTGIEIATKLRGSRRFDETPIVALTGRTGKHARELSLVGGCDGYLTKPIDVSTFPGLLAEFLEGKRDRIDEAERDQYRKEYEESLVDHLTVKIEQLQRYNKLLNDRSEKLRTYSNRLEVLLEVINELQLSQSPEALRRLLVESIVERFRFERCAILEIDHQEMNLRLAETAGFRDDEQIPLNLSYNPNAFQAMFSDRQILFFPNMASVPDPSARNVLQRLGARQFVFGIWGMSSRPNAQMTAGDNIQDLISSLIPALHNQGSENAEIIREHLQEYLQSDFFYLGGYVYIDYRDSKRRFAPYDIKILEMLLHNASLLYQNLTFREQLKALFVRAEKDAITDHLTGLYNYRYFSQQLIREYNRAARHDGRFVLLMLDIDHFKKFNDTFGHQAGDIALEKVSRLLLENTRGSDFVARYGGEEFATICPELNRDEGRKLAEKLCSIISATPILSEEKLPDKRLTISIGVAGFPDDTESVDELVRMADSALYMAKQAGRNRVELYEEALSS